MSLVIANYPDCHRVSEQHQNQILVSHYFTLKLNAQDKYKKEDRILLKEFPSHIFSLERQSYLELKSKQILHVMPLEYFNPNVSDFENTHYFHGLNITDNWIDKPLSEQVMVYFTKVRSVGCPHYIRGCEYSCVTCGKFYGCRLCHDDEVDDHQFDRYVTDTIRCRYCATVQKFGQKCETCKVEFGWYICFTCKMICGLGEDAKPNYHCEGCKICMVGIQKFSKHCNKCGGCFNIDFFDQHECKQPEGNCSVCLDDMVQTIYGKVTLSCGHQMHEHCYQMLLDQQNYKCPVCRKYLPVHEDKKRIINFQKKIYQIVFLPYIFLLHFVKIQCNDCESIFTRNKHPYIYYCDKCDCFNCEEIGESNQHEFDKQQPTLMEPLLPTISGIQQYIIKSYGQELQQEILSDIDEDKVTYFFNFINFNKNRQYDIIKFVGTANKYFGGDIKKFKKYYDEFDIQTEFLNQ
ncbi:RING finger and CHY zinc finger domain-containing protein [Spironucleus salmonicida]|uniref:RING finger and CHY zinc finger domain-containing protein n=1 Tax=Spironucleus salmonicida TaxID=348837 RepID=V6LBW6_9EUKA|nr:RING finger and CHY zinc finger domain-containing protein [Spironucleus salmonicida]|eukprot:EST41703.1 RING finger and CHY zinc finger domain-containing protein [Spironucleus salmonicida]